MRKQTVITDNAKLQEFLNPTNEEYYGNLLLYVRGKSLLKEEKVLEEALLEILQDILDVQENGGTAENYFGKQPKEIADELLKEIPNSFFSSFKLIFTVLFTYSLIVTIPALASPNPLLDVGKLLIGGVYWTSIAMIIVHQIGNDAYTTNQTFRKYLNFSLSALLIILGIVLSILSHTRLTINTEGSVGIALIGGIILICGIFFFKQSDKEALMPFLPILCIGAMLGILYRIPSFQVLLIRPIGKIIAIGLLILGMISFYFLLYKGKKKQTAK